MTTRPYFLLITREAHDGLWHPQFGDFDRDCVLAEREDCYSHLGRKAWKVITCKSSKQADCYAAIARQNELSGLLTRVG